MVVQTLSSPISSPRPRATPVRCLVMTADDFSQPTRLSPMDVHRRLQAGLAEAVVSRAGIRHEGLNAFLRQNLAGTDPSKGALLSEQLFQAAPGYVSSGKIGRAHV